MARINLLDTRTASLGDLISNRKIYKVPPFQRDYSWKQEHWEDLWQDILQLYHNPGVSHYMGAIVLQNSHNSDEEVTIIDGQQRLGTLSILAIAIIDKIQQLVQQQQEPEDNKDRQAILKSTYLSYKDPRSLRDSSKLILNENNNDFYQSNLINFRPPRNVRSLSKSNQLIWQCFQYFSSQLSELTEVIKSGSNLAEFLTNTVAERLLFIQINVEDELNAYTVFETLNARGIELSSTDLLKNYLFSLFQGPDDLQEAQRQWRRIINTVEMSKFPEFLRCYLSIDQPRVRRERLFKLVRQSVKNAQQAFELLDKLESYSSLFMALENPQDEFWRDTPENRPYIQELNLFRVKQPYPTLLTGYEKFSPQDFTRLLKLVSIFSFRYIVVSSLNPNDLEKLYNQVAMGINQGEINTPREVFNHLRSHYVTDEKFNQDFCLMSINTRRQNKKLARYILWKLEIEASARPDINPDINPENFSIEHILPESPHDDWRQNFTDLQIDEMTYRLGNLTPLEPSLNREVGNKNYSIKQAAYRQSCYQLTQNILAEEWTPATISLRQEYLAKKAIQIWRSDFIDN